MSTSREELLHSLDDGQENLFLNLIARHNCKSDRYDLCEVLSTLSKKQMDDVWNHLHARSATCLLHFDKFSDNSNDGIDAAISIMLLRATLTVAKATVLTMTSGQVAPLPLFDTITLLNGVLLDLPPTERALQESIASVCESWWKHKMEGWEHLIPSTIVFYLHKSLKPKALLLDVKRIWLMRDTLTLIDIHDSSANVLKTLLIACAKSQRYLRSDEGRRFIAFLFRLDIELIDSLHMAIKSIIPTLKSVALSRLGEVYFRAWKNAPSDDIKEHLETNCIQDLMYLAVHGKQSTCSQYLVKLLGYIHNQKNKLKDVDEMLYRLYDPFLWRSLKVANGEVRTNAAVILLDVFPLGNLSSNVEEGEELLQRQIDDLHKMLSDECPSVRSVVARGICVVVNKYWEMLPSLVVRTLIEKLTSALAWDSSSVDVRIAVVQGLSLMLDNRSSHLFLQAILPKVRNLFHDISERVRIAMCELLLKMSSFHNMKFLSVVPVDHILARLAIESQAVAKRLVHLIASYYLPFDKPCNEQMQRCLILLRENPAAARRFYEFVHQYTDFAIIARFMAYMLQYLDTRVDEHRRRSSYHRSLSGRVALNEADILVTLHNDEDSDNGEDEDECSESTLKRTRDKARLDYTRMCVDRDPLASDDDLDSGDNEDKRSDVSDTTVEEEFGIDIDLDEGDMIARLLENFCVLWMVCKDQLQKPQNTKIKNRLEKHLATCLRKFMQEFDDPQIVSVLILLAGLLPVSANPAVSRKLLSRLRNFTDVPAVAEFAPILYSVCSWNKGADIMEIICDWLEDCLDQKEVSCSITFSAINDRKGMLALRYLDHLMVQLPCQESLITNNRKHLERVTECLKRVMEHLEKRLSFNGQLAVQLNDELLAVAFERYIRMIVILYDPEDEDKTSLVAMEHVLSWADRHLVGTCKGTKKRKLIRKLLPSNQTLLMSEDRPSNETLSQSMFTSPDDPSSDNMSMTCLEDFIQPLLEYLQSFKNGCPPNVLSRTRRFQDRTGVTIARIVKLLLVINDMMLAGVCDLELTCRIADFLQSVFKCERLVSPVLSTIISIMYHMAENKDIEVDKVKDDDGFDGGQGDPLPKLFDSVIVFISGLAQTKKEQAQRLLLGMKSGFGQLLSTYYNNSDLSATHVQDVMSSITATIVAEMKQTIELDSGFEPRLSVQDLPLLAAFLLTIIIKNGTIASQFISEFELICKSSVVDSVEGLIGNLHLLHAIALDRSMSFKASELKDCLATLQAKLGSQSSTVNLSQNDVNKSLLTVGHELQTACQSKIERA